MKAKIEKIKLEFYKSLREQFKHTTNPYEDTAEFALNEFIAEYISEKQIIYATQKVKERDIEWTHLLWKELSPERCNKLYQKMKTPNFE